MAYPILGNALPHFHASSTALLANGTIDVLNPDDDTTIASYPTAADADATTNANTNPVVLDARGEPPVGIWGINGQAYKLVLKNSAGTTIKTIDNTLLYGSLSSLPYSQGGTGGQATTVGATLQHAVYADTDFGVVAGDVSGNETTNDTNLQAFYDEIASTGYPGVLPPGLIRISTEMTWGNGVGSSQTASTDNAIKLYGAGATPTLSTSPENTTIKWVGATADGSAMLRLKGLMAGCVIDGVYFDGNETVSDCLVLESIVGCRFNQVSCQDFRRYGIHLTVATGSGLIATWGSVSNIFTNCYVTSLQETGTQAWRLAGISADGDPHRNTLIGCVGLSAGSLTSGLTAYGLYLGYADSNTFIECDFQVASASDDGVDDGAVCFDATEKNAFPDANIFHGCSTNPRVKVIEGANTIRNQWFTMYPTGDGETVPAHDKLQGFTNLGRWFGAGFQPHTDAADSLGGLTQRWLNVYANGGLIANTVSLNDDVHTSFAAPFNHGILMVTRGAGITQSVIVAYDVTGTAASANMGDGGSANITVSTGALTDGTGDGTDGHLNVNAHSDGNLYIKNRTGGAITVSYCFLTGTDN